MLQWKHSVKKVSRQRNWLFFTDQFSHLNSPKQSTVHWVTAERPTNKEQKEAKNWKSCYAWCWLDPPATRTLQQGPNYQPCNWRTIHSASWASAALYHPYSAHCNSSDHNYSAGKNVVHNLTDIKFILFFLRHTFLPRDTMLHIRIMCQLL